MAYLHSCPHPRQLLDLLLPIKEGVESDLAPSPVGLHHEGQEPALWDLVVVVVLGRLALLPGLGHHAGLTHVDLGRVVNGHVKLKRQPFCGFTI